MGLRPAVFLAFWLGAAAASDHSSMAAQQAAGQTATARVIGIVEVPRLFDHVSADGITVPPDPAARIELRSRPAADGDVVGVLTTSKDVTTGEYGYEMAGAMAYGRERDWSLVRTTGGTAGWLAPGDTSEFHALEELLDDALAYLTDDWDGFLSTSPAGGQRIEVPADPDRRIVGYIAPVLPHVTVVLQPGQDLEEVRTLYRSSSIGSRPGPDGTRILDVETGIVLPVFEGPDVLTPTVTHIQTNRCDEALQTTHRTPAQVLVFDSRPGWFQVALLNDDNWRNAKRGWLQASALWRFRAVTDEAEARELAERAWGGESRDVRIVAFRTIADALWAEVEVLDDSECRSTEPPKVRARGWAPAHAPSGALNLWFHSRGC